MVFLVAGASELRSQKAKSPSGGPDGLGEGVGNCRSRGQANYSTEVGPPVTCVFTAMVS